MKGAKAAAGNGPMSGADNASSSLETLEDLASTSTCTFAGASAGAGPQGTAGTTVTPTTTSHGGSGVLWSVAQVSGNIMRLTGPVIAG